MTTKRKVKKMRLADKIKGRILIVDDYNKQLKKKEKISELISDRIESEEPEKRQFISDYLFYQFLVNIDKSKENIYQENDTMTKKIGSIVYYDLNELSKELNVTIFTLRNYLKSGKLIGQKLGTRWVVTEENLREFLNNKSAKEK